MDNLATQGKRCLFLFAALKEFDDLKKEYLTTCEKV